MPVSKPNGSDQRTKAKEVWRRATAVCFDVDSTLIQEEGIDKLADYCGAGEQVAEWTKKAMGGSVPFHEALSTRLGLIQPSLQQIADFIQPRLCNPEVVLTPGVRTLVAMLQSRGTAVYLISGGFRQLIEPFAKYLGIPKDHIFANRILFNEEGQYSGFDETEPTCRSGGKEKVVHHLKQKHNVVVMIGDGATDMEASPPADTFIGFGGNVVREKVKEGAPWFVYSFQELINELRPLETHNGTHSEQFEGYKKGKVWHSKSNRMEIDTNGTANSSSLLNGKELETGIQSEDLVE